jgi:ABC-2 type transport system ATP-binding protein
MGLIGPNGAGKSTTIRILMGLVHQDCGEARVLGHRMPAEQVAAKWDIGFASEDMRLYEWMTLGWHMSFVQSIYPNWDAKYAQVLLKRFGLRAEQKVKGLSHGQRVKSILLLVLARRPKLLVLDEPTTGLDPVARHEILRELTDVMADEGRSILFSSHNTQDVEQISDQVTFIDRGRIIDSMDKEMYLDRWRRLRLEVPYGISGSIDGHLRGYSTATGEALWDADLARVFDTVNGKAAHGGSLDVAGPAVVNGMVFVNSGYGQWGGMPGNVFLAFSVDGK